MNNLTVQSDNNALSVIQQMVTSGNFDVSVAKELLEMQKDFLKHQAIINYNNDFALMSKEIPVIAKSKKAHNTSYAPLEDEEENQEAGMDIVCDEFGIVYIVDAELVAYDKQDYEEEYPYPLTLKATIQRDKDDPSVLSGVIMGDTIKVVPQNRIKLQPGVTYV
jgi:hypothetical protein